MNKIIILLLIALVSCGSADDLKKESSIFNTKKELDTLIISGYEIELFNDFKPPLKDVAIYFKLHQNDFVLDEFYFKCNEFEFWIANGYSHFELKKPYKIPFSKKEKDYFWSIYLHVRDNKKVYNWENKVIIKEK